MLVFVVAYSPGSLSIGAVTQYADHLAHCCCSRCDEYATSYRYGHSAADRHTDQYAVTNSHSVKRDNIDASAHGHTNVYADTRSARSVREPG